MKRLRADARERLVAHLRVGPAEDADEQAAAQEWADEILALITEPDDAQWFAAHPEVSREVTDWGGGS